MSHLTLYRTNGACSFIPHALLHELDIPFTTTLLDFGPDGLTAADGSFSHADYLRINPSGFVPALAIDGAAVITELPAVLTYIADLAPDRKLLGASPLEKVRVYEWLAWLSGTLHGQGYGMLFRPRRFVGEAVEMHERVKENGRKLIERCYERIEVRMEGRDGGYAVGEGLTVVDIALYIFWKWGNLSGIEMDRKYPKWREAMVRVEQLESVRKALEEEKQLLQFGTEIQGKI